MIIIQWTLAVMTATYGVFYSWVSRRRHSNVVGMRDSRMHCRRTRHCWHVADTANGRSCPTWPGWRHAPHCQQHLLDTMLFIHISRYWLLHRQRQRPRWWRRHRLQPFHITCYYNSKTSALLCKVTHIYCNNKFPFDSGFQWNQANWFPLLCSVVP